MTNPRLLTIPFADTGTKNEIPVSGAIEPQLATFQAGFPVITQQKIADGGIPPERADFNGILNIYGQHIVHLNKGMPYEFDQDFANAIGGYPLHARIMLSDGQIAQNTIDGNTSNPNLAGTGWLIGISASLIKNANGETQQKINDYIGVNWYAKSGGYALGDRVRLLTGEIVQSTVGANTNNPNNDPEDWLLTSSSGFDLVILLEGTTTAVINKNTAIMQKAINTGKNLELPIGEYSLKTLTFNETCCGQIIKGQGMLFNRESCYTKLNIVDDGGSFLKFQYANTTGTTIRSGFAMPHVSGIAIKADFPIMYNDPRTAIVADSSGNVPYLMRGGVKHCYLSPRVSGHGFGISASKMFNSYITDNVITDFKYHTVLLGCDLNRIKDNRFMEGWSYYILDLSASSFGSQNEIQHNDMVWFSANASRTDGVFIKSTARHARIYDNYLEHIEQRSFVKGFIDCSYKDMPTDFPNANTIGSRFTSIITDNRIDGFVASNDFIYQYQAEGQTFGKIVDGGTTQEAGIAKGLKLIDANLNEVDFVKLTYNAINTASFEFKGVRLGEWDGFKTTKKYNKRVDSSNIAAYTTAAASSYFGAMNQVYLRPSTFLIRNVEGTTSTGDNYQSFLYPINRSLILQKNQVSRVKVRARTIAPPDGGAVTDTTELLRYGIHYEMSVLASEIVTLTRDWQEFSLEYRQGGYDPKVVRLGTFIKRNTANGNWVEVEYIDCDQPYLVATAAMNINAYTAQLKKFGDVYVQAYSTTSKLYQAIYHYRFINSDLILISKTESDATKIAVSVSESSGSYTFAVGGSETTGRYLIVNQS